MADSASIEAAFKGIGEKWGTINVLINNAANSVGTHGAFETFIDEAVYTEAYNRVAFGYVRTTRAALPFMKAARQWRHAGGKKVLEGGSNFRDAGGYPEQGGKRVNWSRLYAPGTCSVLASSSVLSSHRWTGGDHTQQMSRGQERAVLRATTTSAEENWAGGGKGTTPERVRAAMIETYRRLPCEQPALRTLILQGPMYGNGTIIRLYFSGIS